MASLCLNCTRSIVAAMLLFAPVTAMAQSASLTALSADAQGAIKKGIIAAKAQDYLLAILYFRDALRVAPGAPEIYYDLGLAESKNVGPGIARHRLVRRLSISQSKRAECGGGGRSD